MCRTSCSWDPITGTQLSTWYLSISSSFRCLFISLFYSFHFLLTSLTAAKDTPLAACSDALQMFFISYLWPQKMGRGHHVTIMCLTMLVFLGRSASLCLSAAAVYVPWGQWGWSVRSHDLRLWVNSGRSWAQRCRLRFAVSWSEGRLWRACMWSDPSSTNPLGWLGRVGTLVSH